ncbi:hypothetical protein FF1_005226 [Malus domestica]
MTVELVNFPKTEISPTFQSPIKLLAELTVEMHGDLSMMITLQPRLIGKGSNGEMIKSSADEIQSASKALWKPRNHSFDCISEINPVHGRDKSVADLGLSAISKCSNLEVLHIVKAPECSNFGLICVAENCKLLRKLHIDGWRTNRIGDEGLIAISKECPNIQELVLIGVNPTSLSLTAIASKLPKNWRGWRSAVAGQLEMQSLLALLRNTWR